MGEVGRVLMRFFGGKPGKMLKWLLTLVVAIFLLGIIAPHLARFIRFGQLPGDFRLPLSRAELTSSRWRRQSFSHCCSRLLSRLI